ncbi:protein of unknown function [Xenorhabdus nematophila AN6/1]|nr:protein of unknown function [Xenorhabdus nematophila AN6/1]
MTFYERNLNSMMIWYHCLREKTMTPDHHAKNNVIKTFME